MFNLEGLIYLSVYTASRIQRFSYFYCFYVCNSSFPPVEMYVHVCACSYRSTYAQRGAVIARHNAINVYDRCRVDVALVAAATLRCH